MEKSSDADESLLVTGRRAKLTLRRDIATYVEYNTIELEGVILKRVNTAIIDHKMTTYFKCRNMKTPYRVTGVCHFSGRIANFPDNLEIEILNDHNPNCSYLKKCLNNPIGSLQFFYNPIEKLPRKATIQNLKKTKNKKKIHRNRNRSNSSEFYEKLLTLQEVEKLKVSSDIKEVNRLKIPNEIDPNSDLQNADIYIQLWTEADNEKEKEIILKHPNLFQNLII